jgi:hypothetical protein
MPAYGLDAMVPSTTSRLRRFTGVLFPYRLRRHSQRTEVAGAILALGDRAERARQSFEQSELAGKRLHALETPGDALLRLRMVGIVAQPTEMQVQLGHD